MRGEYKEDPKQEDHLTDSLLYAHHFSRHYFFNPPKPSIPQEQSLIDNIFKQHKKALNMPTQNSQLTTPWWKENNYEA